MLLDPKILFEDDFLLIIDKPSGVIVNRCDSASKEETVQDWINENFFHQWISSFRHQSDSTFSERNGIVHRLDKETSGILIIAKNENIFDIFQALFKDRKIHKEYICLVHGLTDKHGEINAPIARHPNKGKFMVDAENGKLSLTTFKATDFYTLKIDDLNDFQRKNYERLSEKFDLFNYSLLSVNIHTGRTHQIRVHFSSVHHPVVGDKLYGYRKAINFDRSWMPRQALHAAQISFIHPVTEENVVIKSPMPIDLSEIIKKYLKAN